MAKFNKNKMFEIVIITKYGSVEGKNVKEINNNQYKFCNYKSDKDFGEVHAFNHKSSRYHIFGKKRMDGQTMKISMNSLHQSIPHCFLEICALLKPIKMENMRICL